MQKCWRQHRNRAQSRATSPGSEALKARSGTGYASSVFGKGIALAQTSEKQLQQRNVVHDANVFARAERKNVSIIEVSVPNAQNIRSGGDCGIEDGVVAWI